MYIDHLKSLISNPNKKKETTQEWNPLFALKLFEMIFVLIFDDIYVSVQVHYLLIVLLSLQCPTQWNFHHILMNDIQ